MRALFILAIVVGLPRLAAACPVCASGSSERSGLDSLLVALMIAAPLVLAAIAYRRVSRLLERYQDGRSASREGT